MSGITAVYVVFAITIASIFAYVFLLSKRQKESEAEIEELSDIIKRRTDVR
jgi:CcmD family protein